MKIPSTNNGLSEVRRYNENYYFLDGVPSLHTEIEQDTQTLSITAPSSAFTNSTYDLHSLSQRRGSTPSDIGGFFNYDLDYLNNSGRNGLSGIFELGAFDGAGTFTSRFVGRSQNGSNSLYRLDSQYSRDFPEEMSVLVLGDSVTAASPFARQYYFGGLQWKTKFATNPGYQYIPLPLMRGTATSPSVVDIYIDNVLRLRQNVDTGPFAINNLPVFTGQGNVQMVVRDVLGRQQLYTQSYINSAQLLRAGVKDYSVEVGALHDGFGTRDDSYGRVFGSGSMRYGYSSQLTLQGTANVMREKQTLGLALTYAIKDIGIVSSGLGYSHARSGNDSRTFIQYDKQNMLNNFSVRVQKVGKRYWQTLPDDTDLASSLEMQLQDSISFSRRMAFSVGYFKQKNRDRPNVATFNAGFNVNFDNGSILNVGLIKSLTDTRDLTVNALYIIPMENYRLLQMTVNRQNGTQGFETLYQRTAPIEGGWGYRLRKGFFDYPTSDIGVNYLGQLGDVSVSANHLSGQNNVEVTARGGLAFMGGHLRASRWITDSFGVVEVPIKEPVDIYANNRWVARTDRDGVGFIPNLIPYEDNKIHLEGDSLPLRMSLELEERFVMPISRSGVLLKFKAKENRSATIILTDESGEPLPAGTFVTIIGADQTAEVSLVALRGRVFISEASFPAIVSIDTSKFRCDIEINAEQTPEGFPVLGPYICKEDKK
ncbi:fimbria/pilus outer membrane usher protein [Undibacterium terreum]|uniref:Fimbrial biogenesis outer membrane usher protein n=1 Tax=Undibacterium terreum TaxID=1224302 RepID=A0A916XC00_9BURK|nr:fimbria/pilus outer membrane usher protein [Undibacterium terreum]GGC59488.1 fimbrial biogenesis outer membrane usher protein [Undibacterium terreum]